MPIKRGRKFFNTPGPTHVPDRVMNAMHQPTLDLSDQEESVRLAPDFTPEEGPGDE